MEYKPRPSTRKLTIFEYTQSTEVEASTRTIGEEGEDLAGRGEDMKDDFHGSDIATIISDWERRARGGEEMDSLKVNMERDRDRRRVSQEFSGVLQKFVDMEREVGEERRTAKTRPSFATIRSKMKTSTSQGRGP